MVDFSDLVFVRIGQNLSALVRTGQICSDLVKFQILLDFRFDHICFSKLARFGCYNRFGRISKHDCRLRIEFPRRARNGSARWNQSTDWIEATHRCWCSHLQRSISTIPQKISSLALGPHHLQGLSDYDECGSRRQKRTL